MVFVQKASDVSNLAACALYMVKDSWEHGIKLSEVFKSRHFTLLVTFAWLLRVAFAEDNAYGGNAAGGTVPGCLPWLGVFDVGAVSIELSRQQRTLGKLGSDGTLHCETGTPLTSLKKKVFSDALSNFRNDE